MQKERESSNSTNCSPDPCRRRFGELRQRLSMQVKRIVDEDKVETGKDTRKRKYTNLQEVHCMKDLKSSTGFEEEYELNHKLGEGCHSSVYGCYSKKENKDYAVKIMKEKDLEIFESIRENYRILRSLEHENIIRVKNLFINEKNMTCHLVLEYCEWEDLQKFMISNPHLKSEEISEIISQILKTLAYMHERGVCHRDIRPENILYNKEKRKIKVIDFDVARIRKYSNTKLEMLTQTGIISYRAPEAFGSPYNEKIDIWAAGVISYQLITGHLPFEGEYDQDCIKKIQHQEPCYENLSLWEQELLQKLLCKKPENRSTAADTLSSPYLFMHEKLISKRPKEGLCRSPSLGKASQHKSKSKEFVNKFYDDELTNLFLGQNEGDIGVIRCQEIVNKS